MSKKKINEGSDLLIPRSQWVPECEIQGTEYDHIESPIFEQAFSRALELHKPKHKVCLVSLCTAMRPYSKSVKWKKYIEHFGDKADLVVCSSGFLVPMEFAECYPYMTYDLNDDNNVDNLYIRLTLERMLRFFSVHHYDRIVFNFRPNLRNRKSAMMFKKMYTGDSEIFILPTQLAYDEAKRQTFKPYNRRWPDLSAVIFGQLKRAIEK